MQMFAVQHLWNRWLVIRLLLPSIFKQEFCYLDIHCPFNCNMNQSLCWGYFINFCFLVFATLNCLTNQILQKHLSFISGTVLHSLNYTDLQTGVVFVLQAEPKVSFLHTESPENRVECMEARLSTQANPVGAIQSKAPSRRSFLVIEQSFI